MQGDEDQQTIGAQFFIAIARDQWSIARELLARGADIDALDDLGRFTPLHFVLDEHYSPERMTWLLEQGASICVTAGEHRETPLHTAVRRRRVETLSPLVSAGALLEARTVGGMTPYRHALRRHFGDVLEQLSQLGADTRRTPGDELAVALQEGDLERAVPLAPAAKVPEWNDEENRLVADLAASGKTGSMELLLELGCPIDSRGLDGGTPLHQAAWFGQPEVVRRLLERGAPLEVRGDRHDSTPLGWAGHGSRYSGGAAERSEVYAEIARELLAAGASWEGSESLRSNLEGASEAFRGVLEGAGWNSNRSKGC